MNVQAVTKHLHAMRMELTRHLHACVDADDDEGAQGILDARKLITAEIDRLLLAELTASLADTQSCVDSLVLSTKDLAALEAKSEQVAKVVGIVESALGVAAKIAAKVST